MVGDWGIGSGLGRHGCAIARHAIAIDARGNRRYSVQYRAIMHFSPLHLISQGLSTCCTSDIYLYVRSTVRCCAHPFGTWDGGLPAAYVSSSLLFLAFSFSSASEDREAPFLWAALVMAWESSVSRKRDKNRCLGKNTTAGSTLCTMAMCRAERRRRERKYGSAMLRRPVRYTHTCSPTALGCDTAASHDWRMESGS